MGLYAMGRNNRIDKYICISNTEPIQYLYTKYTVYTPHNVYLCVPGGNKSSYRHKPTSDNREI